MKEALDLSPLAKVPELHPYFKVQKGERRHLSEMGPAQPAIETLAKEGKAVIQYNLPFDGRQDATVWIPERVAERTLHQEYEQVRNRYLATRHGHYEGNRT